jgi:hypothetical protein
MDRLLVAAREGQLQVVKKLLQDGVDAKSARGDKVRLAIVCLGMSGCAVQHCVRSPFSSHYSGRVFPTADRCLVLHSAWPRATCQCPEAVVTHDGRRVVCHMGASACCICGPRWQMPSTKARVRPPRSLRCIWVPQEGSSPLNL